MKLRLKLTLDINVPVNWDKEEYEEFVISNLEEKYGEGFIECESDFIEEEK